MRLSVRLWKLSVELLTVLAGSCGLAAAQDLSAGKTAAQLFASDCSACHKSPAGLAKGQSAGALASFLREHYTTKPESASSLAAYVAAARGSAPATAAKPDEKPGQKPPRPATTAVEQGEATAPAAPREAAKPSVDPVVAKLNFHAAARGEPKDTARSAGSANKLESYANSGTGAEAVAPDDPNARRKPPDKKKKDNTAATGEAAAPAATPRPRRPSAPAIQPAPDRQ
jgi:hypothetical protein